MSDRAIPSSTSAAQTPGGRTEGRIVRRFRELAQAGELGLIAYITAGDPSLDATEKIVLAAAEAGADVIELGVPFSDPVADGPTIQRASDRAGRRGTTLADVIELVRGKGVLSEGPLATDLTLEEAVDYRTALQARGLDTIFLAAPTSTDARLAKIAEFSSGFLYLISRTGVTGDRSSLPEELPELARRVRRFTKLPLAVGFG